MKVITKGKEWKKRLTCKGCEAVLEIEASDILYKITDEDINSQQYEKDVEGTFYIECPNCGEVLKQKSLSQTVKDRVIMLVSRG